MKTIHARVAAWTLFLVASGCESTLAPKGGTAGQGGTPVNTGQGGGEVCPHAPATNDPECHPEDSGYHYQGLAVEAEGGECTTGLTCRFLTGVSSTCGDQLWLDTYVCCPGVFLNTSGVLPPMHSGFVSTTGACPTPDSGQGPACALPLAPNCAVEGLQCRYDCENEYCRYRVNCCNGAWTFDACPGDAGAD